MSKSEAYIQHPGKVLGATGDFKHIMAITLDPSSNYSKGIARCIVSREGDVTKKGYVDRSQIRRIQGTFPEHFEHHSLIHLGHAEGKDLDSLKMTMPVLRHIAETGSAKELSVAPINSKGVRLNLFESGKKEADFEYSIVRVAIAKDMSGPWEFGPIVFHPKDHSIPWIGGHASPGPLLPKSFIDIGENKLVGIMNGREANKKVGDETKYGMFSVGLFIYDYENGKIEWVSKEPLIQDTEAKAVTFASQFIEKKPGEGILYAHVDDSFVRAYTLKAEGMKKLLPKISTEETYS